MTHHLYEADLCHIGSRLKLRFDNGYTASIIMRDHGKCVATTASVACFLTKDDGNGAKPVEILEHEAFPDEVARFLAEIAGRPSIEEDTI